MKVTKFMTDHRRLPYKTKPRVFTSYFNNDAKDEAKFDY